MNDNASSSSEPTPTLDGALDLLAVQHLMATSEADGINVDALQSNPEHTTALDDNEQQQSPLASTAATVVEAEAEAVDPNETEDEDESDDHHTSSAPNDPHKEHAEAQKSTDADSQVTSDNAITNVYGDTLDPTADSTADGSLVESEAINHSSTAADSAVADQAAIDNGADASGAAEPVEAAAATDAAGDVEMTESVEPEPSVPEAMAVDADASSAVNEETASVDDSSEAPAHTDVAMNESEQQTHDTAADAHTSSTDQEQHESSEHAASSENTDENAYESHAHDENAYESHAHDEYDPSAPYERHERDEYDPAHPSDFASSYSVEYGEDEYDPENPAYEPGEYNPSDPSYDSASGSHDAPADATESESSAGTKRAASTAAAVETGEIPSSPSPSSSQPHSERDAKRQRTDSRTSPRSVSSPGSVDSSDKRCEDKKGLADAAWDRLMDFATLGEFEINQVSRAAFASVGALPEFAQVSIIARFTRVPMKGVRDKNGQLMRIHHEYLKENPHVASLKRVATFIPDASTDTGLYAFGYAPPQPVTGMSTAPVPYQKDVPTSRQAPATVTTTSSPRAQRSAPAAVVTSAPAAPQADVDEFGRTINKKASAPVPATAAEANDRAQRPTDPRRASAAEEPLRPDQPPVAPASRVSGGSATGKPFDPRRRVAGDTSEPVATAQDPRRASTAVAAPTPVPEGAPTPVPVSVFAPTPVAVPAPAPVAAPTPTTTNVVVPHAQPVDPRRRTPASAPPAPAHVPVALPVSAPATGDELYGQLPVSVRAVLDEMIAEGSLRERISDSVVSRLTQLPERVALTAVENFSNVDLSLIDNPEVFLMGIIKRVHDKALAAERAAAAAVQAQAPAPLASGAALTASAGSAAPSVVAPVSLQQQPPPALTAPPAAIGTYDYPPPPLQHMINSLPLTVQQRVQHLAATGAITSIDELGDRGYEALAELSEPLAHEVLTRFVGADLATVRNRSAFLIGVVKRCQQEYGFN